MKKIWKAVVVINLVLFLIESFVSGSLVHSYGAIACFCTLAIIEAIEYKDE